MVVDGKIYLTQKYLTKNTEGYYQASPISRIATLLNMKGKMPGWYSAFPYLIRAVKRDDSEEETVKLIGQK